MNPMEIQVLHVESDCGSKMWRKRVESSSLLLVFIILESIVQVAVGGRFQ